MSVCLRRTGVYLLSLCSVSSHKWASSEGPSVKGGLPRGFQQRLLQDPYTRGQPRVETNSLLVGAASGGDSVIKAMLSCGFLSGLDFFWTFFSHFPN